MTVSKVKTKGTWREVADSARTTIGLDEGTNQVSDIWKKKILLAEHSPIRQLLFKWKWNDLAYWVSVHLVRHWLGIVHFVKTSRSDRTGTPREKLPQDNPVSHECEANAQALINISRKRLCKKASKETQEAWKVVIDEVAKVDPVMASVCVPDCLYRGWCYEMETCHWFESKEAQDRLVEYRKTKE